ncbi:DUF2000 family protein [Mucilaginibacter lappiensis]|uniref:DUF2000 family protein n=1 Tax=Mucilaginibacter lappiensis TaxID=354630 RepID=UPI003D25AE04
MYDNKIAIVIKDDLQSWQKLNVTAFLASSVAIKFPETHGKSLVSASGSTYLPFFKHPILVYKADTDDQIKRAFARAKDRELNIGIYTHAQFGTRNEEQNVTEIGSRTDDELDLVGLIVYGPNKKVDKALDGLRFHS